jgi:omega-amidase
MKIALIQTTIFWENPSKNRKYFEEKINSIATKIDLVVLPEMFTSGFTMEPKKVAETMQGETILWLMNLAKTKKIAVVGSLVITENNNFYNRLVFVFPSGEIQYYDKKHLFTLAGEDKVYTAGNKKLIVDYKGFKICPLICYDLRFPVFSRNLEHYDVLIYVANWPISRINAWDILLRARAVENLCYTIGVNRIGIDDSNLVYNGHSQAIDCIGNAIFETQEKEEILLVTLDKQKMLAHRKQFNFLADSDAFELKST